MEWTRLPVPVLARVRDVVQWVMSGPIAFRRREDDCLVDCDVLVGIIVQHHIGMLRAHRGVPVLWLGVTGKGLDGLVIFSNLIHWHGGGLLEGADDAPVATKGFLEARSPWVDDVNGPRTLEDEVREAIQDEIVELLDGREQRGPSSEELFDELSHLWSQRDGNDALEC